MITTTDLKMPCIHCKEEFNPTMPFLGTGIYASFYFCHECENKIIIRPERSKREDSDYKYCYELYDFSQESIEACNKRIGVVFSKEEADCWIAHGDSRTWNKKKVCIVFPEMRCSEHCGNTVRDK